MTLALKCQHHAFCFSLVLDIKQFPIMVYFQAFNRYSIFGKQIYNLCDSYYTVYTILPYFCLNCVVSFSHPIGALFIDSIDEDTLDLV